MISIHALLAESDPLKAAKFNSFHEFLSTLSLRRATIISIVLSILLTFLSTLSLRRATIKICILLRLSKIFLSTLSLRRATLPGRLGFLSFPFLSTLSLRRATQAQNLKIPPHSISIHALLAESDSKSAQNSGALLRIWNKFYGDCIFMLTGKAVFYPFCPCFFHIFWCEGSGNFMIAFPSH